MNDLQSVSQIQTNKGPRHTRHICTQYWDKKNIATFDNF